MLEGSTSNIRNILEKIEFFDDALKLFISYCFTICQYVFS